MGARKRVPESVPVDGAGTNEELRECFCAGGREITLTLFMAIPKFVKLAHLLKPPQ
jgi:hypothetical protein